MKTIDEFSKEYAIKKETPNEWDKMIMGLLVKDIMKDVKAGIEFAQKWIPIEVLLPERLYKDIPQSNGNTLRFYEKYLVKGYYKNEGKTEDILLATYKPNSVSWYFLVCKEPNTFDFIITHWRPIEYK